MAEGPKHLAPRGGKRRFARIVLSVLVVAAGAFAASLVISDRRGEIDRATVGGGGAADQPAAACGADPPGASQARAAMERPRLRLAKKIDYKAIIYTSCGDIEMDLLERQAPRTVANFVFLAKNGFYAGLRWHEIVPNALIQTGDPNGFNGVSPDGPGYTIRDEGDVSQRAYTYGTVGMANTGTENSAGSQFFIIAHDLEGAIAGDPEPLGLEPKYTVFGQVEEQFFGSVENIARQPLIGGTEQVTRSQPKVPVFIESIEIIERPRT